MDKPNKRPASDEETAPPPAALLHPSADSPFRPLSRRRRQEQSAQPVPAVERPNTSLVFDASPTTVAAVLAKAGRSPAEPVRLAWSRRAAAPGPAADAGGGDPPPPPPAA